MCSKADEELEAAMVKDEELGRLVDGVGIAVGGARVEDLQCLLCTFMQVLCRSFLHFSHPIGLDCGLNDKLHS